MPVRVVRSLHEGRSLSPMTGENTEVMMKPVLPIKKKNESSEKYRRRFFLWMDLNCIDPTTPEGLELVLQALELIPHLKGGEE